MVLPSSKPNLQPQAWGLTLSSCQHHVCRVRCDIIIYGKGCVVAMHLPASVHGAVLHAAGVSVEMQSFKETGSSMVTPTSGSVTSSSSQARPSRRQVGTAHAPPRQPSQDVEAPPQHWRAAQRRARRTS